MTMPIRLTLGALAAAALLCAPALAEIWPGDGPAIGGAIAARVVVEKCSAAFEETAAETLEKFIDKQVAALKAKSAEEKDILDRALPALEADYQLTMTCSDSHKELATDMLLRVKRFEAGVK
jgi:hypothetical protein